MTEDIRHTNSKGEAGSRSRRVEMLHPSDFVAGWFFPIAMPAFQTAIDLERSPRVVTRKEKSGVKIRQVQYVWSQRNPPQFAFAEGDIFHAPPCKPAPWGEQLATLRWTVQVKKVVGASVIIRVTQHREKTASNHEIAMADLAGLLQTGRLPPFLDFTAPRSAGED